MHHHNQFQASELSLDSGKAECWLRLEVLKKKKISNCANFQFAFNADSTCFIQSIIEISAISNFAVKKKIAQADTAISKPKLDVL